MQHELPTFEQPHGGAVGVEQLGHLPRELVEDRARVELDRQLAAGARELLCEPARAPLELVRLAALERATRGARDLLRQLEVVVGEEPLVREEDDHEAAALATGLLERHGKQRLGARRFRLGAPGGEALVPREPRRRQHPVLVGGEREGAELGAVLEQRLQLGPDVVAAGEVEVVADLAEDCGSLPAEGLCRRLRDRVERGCGRERLAEDGCDAVEASLDAGLPRALLERLGVPERDRCEPGEGLKQHQVVLGEAVVLE